MTESNRATQSAANMKFAASSRSQHSPVCMVQFCTVSSIKVTITMTPRALSDSMSIWHVVGRWYTSEHYVVTTDFHWVAAEYTV